MIGCRLLKKREQPRKPKPLFHIGVGICDMVIPFKNIHFKLLCKIHY